MSFHAYVFFSGDCAAAFQRYHEVFGGELSLMRATATRPRCANAGYRRFRRHARLTKVGDGLLMGSDDLSGDDGPKTGFSVCYTAPDVAIANRVFNALADGGGHDADSIDVLGVGVRWSSTVSVCRGWSTPNRE